MEQSTLWFAFGLTVFAGLATGIGSLIALFAKQTNTKFLSVALGFSAGVMIYVSMVEIFQKAKDALTPEYGLQIGTLYTALGFFGGIFLIALIDKLIPSDGNPHEVKRVEELEEMETAAAAEMLVETKRRERLYKVGIFSALAIAIHNFPEGLATFVAAVQDPALGIPIAVAIAIHNIPEGIAVSIPLFYATGSRIKAFRYSFLSGLAEPVGAAIGFLILMPYMSDTVFGILFASVAGIMVFISLDELLPAAREYGEAHLSIYGLIAGMMVMAASLILFL